jgi:hypothetical protein
LLGNLGSATRKNDDTMPNKVALAYMVSNFLFVLMGIFVLAFSVIVENIQNEEPLNGRQAARNLLYQRFPLRGKCDRCVQICVDKRWRLTECSQLVSPMPGWSSAPSS